MEGVGNSWWLDYVAVTLTGQGMELEESTGFVPPLMVHPHHSIPLQGALGMGERHQADSIASGGRSIVSGVSSPL